MNTVSTRDEQSTVLPLRLVRRSSALGNLIRKECQESREALIVGLVVFWSLPVLLELIDLALERPYATFPLALWLLMGAGWLYAIIVGAHSVCRDWGKAEEYFLLAQPVSPRTVVRAKLTTGAVLVAGVIAVVVAWETMLAHWGAFGTGSMPADWGAFGTGSMPNDWGAFGTGYTQEWQVITISVACVMAVGYALAFAAAVMSRQMLASTVVASLVMVVWAILPLLSSRLTRFGALVLLSNEPRTGIGVPFVLVSVLGLIVCVATSFFCSTRERVIRLGHRQLAWAVGLVTLTLFGVAMTEVGNSLRVRDQAELFDLPAWARTRMIQRGNRFFAIKEGRGRQAWQMATFRVADNGRIKKLRRAVVPGTAEPAIHLDHVSYGFRLLDFTLDDRNQLVASRVRYRYSPGSTRVDSVWRATMTCTDEGEIETLSHAELKLPDDKNLDVVGNWDANVGSRPSRYAYLVSTRSLQPETLYVFDWLDSSNPAPRFVISLPQDTDGVTFSDGQLRIWPRDKEYRFATFDADHPETLLDKQNWSYHVSTNKTQYERFGQFERPGGIEIRVDRRGNFAYLSDLFGLRVARKTPPGQWEIVGECRASPLAFLFRSTPKPKALDDSLLVERGSRGIITYDISDPSRPRRTGFLNTVYPDWRDTVFVTQRYLVLREFNLITILDRPDLRAKGNP